MTAGTRPGLAFAYVAIVAAVGSTVAVWPTESLIVAHAAVTAVSRVLPLLVAVALVGGVVALLHRGRRL